jgi:antirestriction protein ArdC
MNVYEIITERILRKLEEGTVPWRKPCLGGDGRMVVQAAAHAQKTADFILGRTSESASDMGEDENGDAAQAALA